MNPMSFKLYFDREVLDLIDYNNSCCVVTKEKPIKNETKYNLNDIGFIKEISKSLVRYDGGVFAIRFIKSQDLIIFFIQASKSSSVIANGPGNSLK